MNTIADLQAEVSRLRAFEREMTERFAAQSYALSRAAEKQGELAKEVEKWRRRCEELQRMICVP